MHTRAAPPSISQPLLVFLLAALSMLGALSIDAYLPALPTITAQFKASDAASQQTLSIYLFAFALMTLFYGTLSDSFGRKPVLICAMIAYLIGSTGATFSPSLGWLLFFRLLQGLSAGAGSVIGRAIVGDLMSGAEARKLMSYISMVFGLAPAIAPIMGGWLLTELGWRSIFATIAIFSLLLLLACSQLLQETLPIEQRSSFRFRVIMKNYWEIARHPQFLLRCIGTALTFCGVWVYVGSAPSYVLDVIHLTSTGYGWLFVPIIAAMSLGSFVSAKLSARVSPSALILTAYSVMGISAVGSVLYSTFCIAKVPWAVLPIACYSFGMALCGAAMTMTTLEMFPKVRGVAASMQSFVFMMGFSIGAGFICPLLFGSGLKMSIAALIGVFLSAIFWYMGRIPDAKLQETAQ